MTAPSSPLSTAEIREKFLSFFESKGHLRLPSASTVAPDPTTLFTVAGMQPFKAQFMGAPARFEQGANKRVTTAQKCLRVGDIENVGRTLRHCSLLEMLGNFSFGDYFKRESLTWSWEFLTGPEWMGLDKSKVYVTIYEDDEEAFDIWTKDIGLPEDHLLRFGADENFWPADAPKEGPNGPCGPCSEIFYDRGPKYGDDTWAEYAETCESARFLELWNNVFPQFDRQEPQPDGTPTLVDLPFKNIDTGMSLERIATVVQDVYDFYSNDVFGPIIAKVAELSGQPYEGPQNVSHRVVAEHVRSVSMVIADGSAPGNTGRGYVIRKILRRASRHAYLLGLREPTLYKLVPLVVSSMGDAYPELRTEQARVEATIRSEEERFLRTLEDGMPLVEKSISETLNTSIASSTKNLRKLFEQINLSNINLSKAIQGSSEPLSESIKRLEKELNYGAFKQLENLSLSSQQFESLEKIRENNKEIADYIKKIQSSGIAEEFRRLQDQISADTIKGISPITTNLGRSIADALSSLEPRLLGETAFKLSDTHGVAVDLTKEIAEEYGVSVDEAGYAESLENAQNIARAGSKYGKSELFGAQEALEDLSPTEFVGYDYLEADGEVLALLVAGERLEHLGAGDEATVVLSRTPFYAEGGGEVGDTGRLEWDSVDGGRGAGVVRDTRKTPGGVFLHDVAIESGELKPGQSVRGVVSGERQATQRHHTATHLLHAALRAVLGSGVRQAGSLVAPDRLRFDFSHGAAMTADEIAGVERLVSRWVSANFPVTWQEMPIAQARAAGATALFGEKYGDTVRVVSVGGNVSYGGQAVASMELCGGAHVKRTGDIGAFVILGDENVAAGVRRVEALAGEAATDWLRERLQGTARVSAMLNTNPDGLEGRVSGLQAQLRAAEKETVAVRRQLAEAQMGGGSGAAPPVRELGGFKVASLKLAGIEGNELRGAADKLLDQSGADVVVVAGEKGLVVKATKDAVARGAHAGQLVGRLAAAGGGKGGGRPDMAQAGITDAEAALEALDTAF
ncbi:alanine--tRNA ligase-related protein [Deinococcus frigens]|uniref:alanine--tRNA ligase-related protein n=1 Tax=Deinococcus frigens TaxID=249403 RepID=UPI000495B116|nr:alanine--tRNA ligase-related protein [Deinococcus frigens]